MLKQHVGDEGRWSVNLFKYESFPSDEMLQSKMDYPCERRGAARWSSGPNKSSIFPLKALCFFKITFALELWQWAKERVLGHYLLVNGVLETHGAGVGTGHRQIRLHGWVNKQRVRWKTIKNKYKKLRRET